MVKKDFLSQPESHATRVATQNRDKLPLEDQISEEHFKAIGLVVAEWAAVERYLLYILCDLIVPDAKQYDDYGATLLLATGVNYRAILVLMLAVVKLRFPNDAKEFQKIVEGLENSASKRDVFAHGAWIKGEKEASIASVELKSVGAIKWTHREYTVPETRRIAVEMHERMQSLVNFLKARGAWHNPPTTNA